MGLRLAGAVIFAGASLVIYGIGRVSVSGAFVLAGLMVIAAGLLFIDVGDK